VIYEGPAWRDGFRKRRDIVLNHDFGTMFAIHSMLMKSHASKMLFSIIQTRSLEISDLPLVVIAIVLLLRQQSSISAARKVLLETTVGLRVGVL
jgi:hypothetical protein